MNIANLSHTPKCRLCGLEVRFLPHPQNPAKMAPFNLDGEIHFATCSKKEQSKTTYSSLTEIGNCSNGHPASWLYIGSYKVPKLVARCSSGHFVKFVFDTPGNRQLVNCPSALFQS